MLRGNPHSSFGFQNESNAALEKGAVSNRFLEIQSQHAKGGLVKDYIESQTVQISDKGRLLGINLQQRLDRELNALHDQANKIDQALNVLNGPDANPTLREAALASLTKLRGAYTTGTSTSPSCAMRPAAIGFGHFTFTRMSDFGVSIAAGFIDPVAQTIGLQVDTLFEALASFGMLKAREAKGERFSG